MLWEYLFGIPIYPNAPVLLLMILDLSFIVLFVVMACISFYFVRKMAPWKEVIKASGGTLGIFVDAGHRVHFYNLKNKFQYGILKDWNFVSINPEGIYRATKQNCNVGIWSTRICVPLPVHLSPVAQTTKKYDETMADALKRKYGEGKKSAEEAGYLANLSEPSKKGGKQGEGAPIEQFDDNSSIGTDPANFYQFLVDKWENWFGTVLNGVLYKLQVEDTARGLAELRMEADQKGFKLNWKLLVGVLAVVIVVAAFLMLR